MTLFATSKRRHGVLPGFGLTLGFTVFYLSVIVLIPLSAMFFKSAQLGLSQLWQIITAPRVLAAAQLTFGSALIAATINTIFGFIVAWVLVRYTFPAKRLIDAMVDLPFALPTAVSGIALTAIYAPNGWIGKYLTPLGIKTAYSPLGVTIALIFIGLPFVVRTLQPAIEDIDIEIEDAAASLGASRPKILRRIIIPTVMPAMLTGFALAFARGIGEYGTVVFISGNMPMKTEIVPLIIIAKLEQYDYLAATAIGASMLVISFMILLAINLLQWWSTRRRKGI